MHLYFLKEVNTETLMVFVPYKGIQIGSYPTWQGVETAPASILSKNNFYTSAFKKVNSVVGIILIGAPQNQWIIAMRIIKLHPV